MSDGITQHFLIVKISLRAVLRGGGGGGGGDILEADGNTKGEHTDYLNRFGLY